MFVVGKVISLNSNHNMIVLSFTKSEVKLDGEKADTKDNNYQNVQVKLIRIRQIDVNVLTSSTAPVHQTLMLTDW